LPSDFSSEKPADSSLSATSPKRAQRGWVFSLGEQQAAVSQKTRQQ